MLRGVAVANERLGFVHRKTARYRLAIDEYQRERTLVETLTSEDQADFQWRRDGALAAEGLGDVYRDQRQWNEAGRFYMEYLKTENFLHGRHPQDARIERDLAVAHERVAEYALQRGDKKLTASEYSACVKTAVLASRAYDPRNPEPAKVGDYCRRALVRFGLPKLSA